MVEENKELIQVDVNIEKMPIICFGKAETRHNIEKKIIESKEPYVISSKVDDGIKKTLKIVPHSIYGLPSDFDQDVIVVFLSYLHNLTNKLGVCPKNIRIPLSDFPKIMGIKKQGKLYKQIEESVERLSNLDVTQENFVQIKEAKGTLKKYDKFSLKIFHYRNIHKEEKITKTGKKLSCYVDLDIPDWVQNNVNNAYTTAFDVKKYFELKGGRVRKLYRFLELIRYRKKIFVRFEKLYNELWISDHEEKLKKRTLKRTFEGLIKDKFITSFLFDRYGVIIIFKSVKKKRKKESNQQSFETNYLEESMVSEMIEKTGDKKSKNYFKKIARICPEDMIYRCLSLTREVEEIDGIKTSKGAVFVDILKRECAKFSIDIS